MCQGPLRLTETGGFQLYRCHVGHAFSGRSIVMENEDHIERTLWAAARALEEQANLARRAAVTSPGSLRQRLEEKAELHSEQAKTIRKILLSD